MKTQRWIDLSPQGIYLGSIKMADGVERLALLDMNDSVDPERLLEIGFHPFEGSPRFDRGIYYMAGEQGLRPSKIAAALGMEKCPLVEVEVSEIDKVFRERCIEKFASNLNAVTLRADVLGVNANGEAVYQSPAGRFVRTSDSEALTERSAEGRAVSRALFLRAETDEELRTCADGFVGQVLGGKKASWQDLQKFAQVVFGKHVADSAMHRLQEAVEASAGRAFATKVARSPSENAFHVATDLYYGLPAARMRTSESIFLQQYSTPLPLAVVAQRLLIGSDDLAGKTVFEPTAGNGALINLIPETAQVYALELDRKRLEALKGMPRIVAELGDATDTPFRVRFALPDGFDYTIANPPFGSMADARSFDKLPSVRRVDHFIALRTLAARKDEGRSVLIFGADSAQSTGEVKGGAKHFLNYVHDHYEVHGLVELDGRMYTRHGAGYNVRLMVIGARLPEPRQTEIPDKLPLLTGYDDLWAWADRTVAEFSAPRARQSKRPGVIEPQAGDVVRVRGGQHDGTIRTLIGETADRLGFVVSDALSGQISVPAVEFHRSPADPKVGARVRFTAADAGDPLSVGVVEGLLVDAATTSAGNMRYRIRTDEAASQGPGFVEKLVYSHQGRLIELRSPLTFDRVQVGIFERAPMDVPEGWLVMNASRPLLGTRTFEDDDAWPGRKFYAAIDPGDAMSQRYIDENVRLDARAVLVAGRPEQVAMAVLRSEYRDRYYEMDEAERDRAADAFVRKLNEKAYGEAALLLAEAREFLAVRAVETSVEIDVASVAEGSAPVFTTSENPPAVVQVGAMNHDGREPWQMTSDEWSAAVAQAKAAASVVRGAFPGGQQAAAIGEVARLQFEVTKWYDQRAKAGDADALEWMSLPMGISHQDVIAKAKQERRPVPNHVLSEYPELMPRAPERRVNEFQAPYQAASKLGQASSMVPINMAGSTYAALNDLEAREGPVDDFVAGRLQYTREQLGNYFDPGQIDALALAIQSVETGRGIINADQTGMGKGRFVAGMMRYAKLNDHTPIFITIKPELFTDIFRDIEDIGSRKLFNKLFIFNEGVHVMRFGTEDEILYRATSQQERRKATDEMDIDPSTDMVLATYSQFQRAAIKNLKSQLLTAISQKKTMVFLDEAHVASGASNISAAVGEPVANTRGVIYSSATPLKGVSNFAIYNKVFPASVDLKSLPDTLRTGGEALQEAISANMARDGVLVRREHDFSKLTFVTRLPSAEKQAHNVALANKLSETLAGLSYLAGDVSKLVGKMNKTFEGDWDSIPESDRKGQRMRASSMNFGSRLYALNRQFLLGIKIEEAVQASLDALQAGRKPVIAVENTGESLLRQVLSRRAGVDALEKQLEELDERSGTLTDEERRKRDELQTAIGSALRNVRLEEPPQFRDLLEIMLDRIGEIKVQGRYGDVRTERPSSEEYAQAEEELRAKIREFPDLPLTPLDVLRHELGRRGFPVTEVSGRTASLSLEDGRWAASFHPKSDAVASVAGFQNGKFDAAIITRSGSTGISLHATDRFDDSDTRQRDFIVLQKAANIAEFLQWLGRVNRKDQVIEPIITGIDSGLPAELRLTMMHNAKLRKLSANTTSNRENANTTGEDHDLLNEVGDSVALQWLQDNPDVADYLDIALPKDDDEEVSRLAQDFPYVNKLLGRLMMCSVDKQQEILEALTRRFNDKLEELEQQGINPFKVDVYEWGATIVKEEELQSGVLKPSGSTFDEAVKLTTVEFERDVYPIRAEKLLGMVRSGSEVYRANAPLGQDGTLQPFVDSLRKASEGALRSQLPLKLRESELSLGQILASEDLPVVLKAKAKQEFLLDNIEHFKPGAQVTHADLFKGEMKGFVTSVSFPNAREDLFLLSKYGMRVVFPGEEKPKDLSLATLFNQGQSLAATAYRAIDLDKMARFAYVRTQIEQALKAFDEAPDGKVKRRAHLLQGNIFRACELANQQKLGAPILFTDAGGNRQRAVLLKDRITPEAVKSLPIGLDWEDAAAYIDEFLRPNHRDHRSRSMYGGVRLFDVGVQSMVKGEGVLLEVLNGARDFRLSIPGTKSRAGRLMTDGAIFDIGEKTLAGGMRLKLSGTKAFMSVDVPRERLPELMRHLQGNGHVGKFYIPNPDQDVLQALKRRYAEEKRVQATASHEHEPA